jgi:hypothetical protein
MGLGDILCAALDIKSYPVDIVTAIPPHLAMVGGCTLPPEQCPFRFRAHTFYLFAACVSSATPSLIPLRV